MFNMKGWLDFSTLQCIVPLFRLNINKQSLTKKISLLELFFVVVYVFLLIISQK